MGDFLNGLGQSPAEPASPPAAFMLRPVRGSHQILQQADGMACPGGGIVLSNALQCSLFQGGEQAGKRTSQVVVEFSGRFLFNLNASRFKPQLGVGRCPGAGRFHFRHRRWRAHRLPVA